MAEDKNKFIEKKAHPLDAAKTAMAEEIVTTDLDGSITIKLDYQSRLKLGAIRIFNTSPHRHPTNEETIAMLLTEHYMKLSSQFPESVDEADTFLEVSLSRYDTVEEDIPVKRSSIFSKE